MGHKINKENLKDRVAFGDINEEMGNLDDDQVMEYLKVAYDGNDKSILAKFEDKPTQEQVNRHFDKKVLDKTEPVNPTFGKEVNKDAPKV